MRSLYLALRDQLTPRLLLYALLPLLVVMPLLAWAAIDLLAGDAEGGVWLIDLFARIPLLGGAAEYAWVRTVLGLVGQTAGWLLVLLAGLFLAVALVGMLTPAIVAEVRRRHYAGVAVRGSLGLGDYLRFLGSTLLRFMLLALLVLPLLFVPVVNLLAIHLPFYYWFHRLLSWDVLTTLFTPDQVTARRAQTRFGLLWRTALLYPLSLLPLVGLLLQVLFVLVLAHYLLGREARATEAAAG